MKTTKNDDRRYKQAMLAANRRYHARTKRGTSEVKVCSICKMPYTGWGHAAWPINVHRCCDVCQDVHVLPARLASLFE